MGRPYELAARFVHFARCRAWFAKGRTFLRISRCLRRARAVVPMLLISACGSGTPPMSPTPTPTPTANPATANVYILPGAVALGANAFGDEAIVVSRESGCDGGIWTPSSTRW